MNMTGQPLLDWLTGNQYPCQQRQAIIPFTPPSIALRPDISSNRPSIWIRYVGYAGTVTLFDNSRVTVARRPNPKDGFRYYTRPMAMEHYELLREFIDSAWTG